MKSFSQRKGIKPVKRIMQVDSMDSDLKNGLWNALTLYYWDQLDAVISRDEKLDTLFKRLWHNYFKKPLDTLHDFWDTTYQEIRKYFPDRDIGR